MKIKEQNNSKINIVSFMDSNVYDGFLLLYSSIDLLYDNYSFYVGVEQELYQKIESKLDMFKNIKFVKLNDNSLMKYKSGNARITNIAFARFYIYDYFPELRRKSFVYSDTDIIFKNKIDDLYFSNKKINYSFVDGTIKTDKLKPKVIDFWSQRLNNQRVFKKIESLIKRGNYFNSGLFIINNRYKFNKLIKKIKRSKYEADDQNLLNFYNKNEFTIINSNKDNVLILIENDDIDVNKISSAHFVGRRKPWDKNFIDDSWIKQGKEKANFDNVNNHLKYLLEFPYK